MEKSSELLKECMEKIKVSSAEIIVNGTREKPYYEIKYHDLSDGQIHIGYSSYNLDFVFEWLEECFEIVNQSANTIKSLSAKLQAANMERSAGDCGGWIPCKERLPENDGFYLATIDGEIAGEDKPFSGLAEFENGKWIDDEDDYQCVIAWKPLPEPYHEL